MNSNVARHLDLMAAARPRSPAIKIPRGRTRSGDIDYLALSFSELSAEVGAWEFRLSAHGIRPGDRALVLVRPGLPLIAAIFALFRLNAVPVVIDPGMGLRSFLACVARTQPRALVGIPRAQLIGRIFRRSFRSVSIRVPVPGDLTAQIRDSSHNVAELVRVRQEEPKSHDLDYGRDPVPTAPNTLAAILFTSGSTGSPKGVRYEHGMFEAQIAAIRDCYKIEPGEVDLPLLPVFALFNPALGMTTIVPEIDPRRPATVDPAKIVQAIRQEKVTNSFGSPTLWRIIGAHCRSNGIKLGGLRRVLCAGAPVPADLWESAKDFLPDGRLYSPYGATEALPVSSIDDLEFAALGGSPASGAPVGKPLPGIEVKIIAPADGPIAKISDARELPPGEIGEIVARGPVVTREYDSLPEATALAKIEAPGSGVFHRMGDCGRLDSGGRLWFLGRKVERVETTAGILYSESCERVFRSHPKASRCALIGLGPRGSQTPAIVAETSVFGASQIRALALELRALAVRYPHTAAIRRYFFHPKFPVDTRHNAKIHRLTLARLAERGALRGIALDE